MYFKLTSDEVGKNSSRLQQLHGRRFSSSKLFFFFPNFLFSFDSLHFVFNQNIKNVSIDVHFFFMVLDVKLSHI